MKFKVQFITLSVMLCANAIADPVYLPPAQNLTYGSSSNNQSIMSSITNPAAAAAQLEQEGSQYRFGILSSIGGGYEFGNFNDLYNTIDSTKATITTPITTVDLTTAYTNAGCTATCTAAQGLAFATAITNKINSSAAINDLNNKVLPALQRDGYASVYAGGHVPLTPFVVTKKSLGGSIVLDANVSAIANLSVITDPLLINTATVAAIATAYQNYVAGGSVGTFTLPTIPNDSTLLIKAAMVKELGLGYSRPVLSRDKGDMTAGVRVKYYQVLLDRSPQKLVNSTGSKNTLNAGKTYTTNSGVGLDVGTLWTAKRYRVGAWVNNINKPSFKYNDLTTAELNLAGYYATTTAPAVYNQLTTGLTYEMKPQLQLEGAFFSESQNWVLNAGLDANAVKDPVGRDFQWATLSAAYATDSWWKPGARLGYRTNLAGSKLSYVTGGLTIFKGLSFDVAYGLDKITDKNGKSIPRSLMANIGIQLTF